MATVTTRPGIKVKFGVKYPAKIVAVAPLSATLSGGVWTLTWSSTDVLGGTCWVWQLKKALANAGQLLNVEIVVPADPSSSTNILWTVGARTSQGDTLSNFIKATLGWNDSQMASLYASATLQIT